MYKRCLALSKEPDIGLRPLTPFFKVTWKSTGVFQMKFRILYPGSRNGVKFFVQKRYSVKS